MKLGTLDSAAFVVGFPILGCILQCMLLPLVYDSPVSLGLIQDYSCSQLHVVGNISNTALFSASFDIAQ